MNDHTIFLTAKVLGSPAIISPRSRRAITPKVMQKQEIAMNEKGSDYAKIAKAIGAITSKGIEVSLVNINTSDYGYKPDVEHNRILYGLKALSNISGGGCFVS